MTKKWLMIKMMMGKKGKIFDSK